MGSFSFKQFSVSQTKSSMKVNTDGVLLGAWAKINPLDRQILDIGTGTGVIALMMAQRAPESFIMAVEIDKESSLEAERNFTSSKWANRLKVDNTSIQEFATKYKTIKFDHIISNPPYFDQSLKSEKERKSVARHSDCGLSFTELASCSANLLSETGRLSVVIPYLEMERMVEEAAKSGLTISRCTYVRTTKAKQYKRVLLEFSKEQDCALEERLLTIHSESVSSYSEEYRELLKDFYLAF